MKVSRHLLIGLLAQVAGFSTPLSGQDINTIVGPSLTQPVGITTTQWVGQTFTVPAAEVFLNSVTFWYGLSSGTPTPTGNIRIVKWANGATSDTIFEATLVIPTQSAHVPASLPLTTYTVSLALDAGATYMAYLSATTPNVAMASRYYSNNAYTGGSFWVSGDVGNSWFEPVSTLDLAFQADFSPYSPVPEPATVILLATGLLGIGGVGVARRRKALG